jgi:putative hydrolase of the HAD superfamily
LKVSYLLFDAANTLIWKPELFNRYATALEANGHIVDKGDLKRNHKLISEAIKFPDRTSEEFYHAFNSEVLLSLGILPTEKLLKEIFDACTYLEWAKYEDTSFLSDLHLPLGILSNFNRSLPEKITGLCGDRFRDIIVSENMGVAKPSLEFYTGAIQKIGIPAGEILYIGDSLKLDIVPALKCGMQAWLIDREGWFKAFDKRIGSFSEINRLCKQ